MAWKTEKKSKFVIREFRSKLIWITRSLYWRLCWNLSSLIVRPFSRSLKFWKDCPIRDKTDVIHPVFSYCKPNEMINLRINANHVLLIGYVIIKYFEILYLRCPIRNIKQTYSKSWKVRIVFYFLFVRYIEGLEVINSFIYLCLLKKIE